MGSTPTGSSFAEGSNPFDGSQPSRLFLNLDKELSAKRKRNGFGETIKIPVCPYGVKDNMSAFEAFDPSSSLGGGTERWK